MGVIYVLVTLDGSMVKFGHTTTNDLQRAVTQTGGYPCRFYCALDGAKTHEKRTHRYLKKLGLGIPGDNGQLLEEWHRLEGEAREYVEWLGQQPFCTVSTDTAADDVWPCPGRFIFDDWRAALVPDQIRDQLHFELSVADYFVPGLRCPRRSHDGWLTSLSDEWYTPPEYIDAAHEVLGAIDLDPASCAVANKVVRAETILTREVNGLNFAWHGRVYLNPPYGTEAPFFVEHLMGEVAAGRTSEAIVCLNANSQETRWFQPLWEHTLCFVRGRVHFYNPTDTTPASPNKGSVFVYIGPNSDLFVKVFSRFGNVVRRLEATA